MDNTRENFAHCSLTRKISARSMCLNHRISSGNILLWRKISLKTPRFDLWTELRTAERRNLWKIENFVVALLSKKKTVISLGFTSSKIFSFERFTDSAISSSMDKLVMRRPVVSSCINRTSCTGINEQQLYINFCTKLFLSSSYVNRFKLYQP